jgi:predicted O-linked N-acetylglucosamine transferase (SPINDLY family)
MNTDKPKQTPALLDKAKQLMRAGQPAAAAEMFLQLASKAKGLEKARLVTQASLLLRKLDAPRALQLSQEATQLAPKLAQAWMALSYAADEKRDRKASIAAALKALEFNPTPVERVDLGRHLSRLGEDRASLEAVRAGYEASKEAIGLASYTLRVALQTADWDLAEKITARLREAHAQGKTKEIGETPRTHLLWCADEQTNIAVIKAFAEKHYPERPPLVKSVWPDSNKRKLRIGYLSYDFRDHATSLLAMGLLRHHDRDRFEIYGYCTSFDDGSAMRRDILSRFDKAKTLSKLDDLAAAKRIAADRIDVLIDFNGLTEGTRHGILAWRPAPVQICYLGYPGSAGGRFVDYIIGDELTVPKGAEALYPEHVIRIPHTYQINDYLARYLPPRTKRRPEGLPEGKLVLGMFNNVNKVGREAWSAWMRILKAAPDTVLWMLEPGPVAREYLAEATRRAGVDPARVVYAAKMKQEPHLARMQYCDLMLDPWPYGGHTTTGDALFAGVPVLTLEGTNFASRVSGGLVKAAGMPGLVLPDVEAYVERALLLIRNPKEIEKLHQYLLRNRARLPVFDAPGRTRQLEAAYMQAHARAVRGLPPQHLHVRFRNTKASSS